MPSVDNCDDPWQTPSAEVDAEVLETSQRLVEKSNAQWPQSEPASPNPELELAQQKITELELQQKRIFQRNVSLTAEIAQLRATNQRLTQELAQHQRPPQKLGWWQRFFGR
ncbi:hypothetical protein HRE53_07090 [Acaryochloris sp. 'Moss Beach']|uniref:hypothetical protein n=1 Tax=Acaryochloris sp. 'Moss Beach' TaxID=2740837 RepID=UPI001F2A804A|nr:hypothetical protein [Acaryochloris sp. 'Moss Beach']UJB70813.1 hypothetical protein HRE53_07090 [Acaryochloris sp. 'Moss Beach']